MVIDLDGYRIGLGVTGTLASVYTEIFGVKVLVLGFCCGWGGALQALN